MKDIVAIVCFFFLSSVISDHCSCADRAVGLVCVFVWPDNYNFYIKRRFIVVVVLHQKQHVTL